MIRITSAAKCTTPIAGLKITYDSLIPGLNNLQKGDLVTHDKYNGQRYQILEISDQSMILELDVDDVPHTFQKGIILFKALPLVESVNVPDKWKSSDAYADAKYHVKKGDHISKYEKYEEIKEAYEAGYDQAVKDLHTKNSE